MKFGVFYEHQLPRPWTRTSEYDLLRQSLDQFQFADQLGYDYAWVVEHHFLEEYSHSSAPEVFLGAVQQPSTCRVAREGSKRRCRKMHADARG
jgi:hypothetical protein